MLKLYELPILINTVTYMYVYDGEIVCIDINLV